MITVAQASLQVTLWHGLGFNSHLSPQIAEIIGLSYHTGLKAHSDLCRSKKVTGQRAQGYDWGLFPPHCLLELHLCYAVWPQLPMSLWMWMCYTLSIPPNMKVSCHVWWDGEPRKLLHSAPLARSHYWVGFQAIKSSLAKFYSFCQPTLQNGSNNLQCTIQCEELTMRHDQDETRSGLCCQSVSSIFLGSWGVFWVSLWLT